MDWLNGSRADDRPTNCRLFPLPSIHRPNRSYQNLPSTKVAQYTINPCKTRKTPQNPIRILRSLLVAEMGFEPHDLRVMSPTSYRAAPLRDIHTASSAYILSQSGKNVKCFSKISYSSESKNAYIFSSGFFCIPADSPKTIVSFFPAYTAASGSLRLTALRCG